MQFWRKLKRIKWDEIDELTANLIVYGICSANTRYNVDKGKYMSQPQMRLLMITLILRKFREDFKRRF